MRHVGADTVANGVPTDLPVLGIDPGDVRGGEEVLDVGVECLDAVEVFFLGLVSVDPCVDVHGLGL